MEKLIIILSVVLVLGIIAFGAYQFKKLRRNQANLKSANIQGQDADRIVYAYRVEENYVRQRSRIWMLTILASAFVILTGFGSAYYLHNKDVWAVERAEKAQRQAQEKVSDVDIQVKNAIDNKVNATENITPDDRKNVCSSCARLYFIAAIIAFFLLVATFGFIFWVMNLKN
ncbi:MAG: hypothetical protein IJ479_06700 [Alphaproteobacteria bacterium]|nr:hypothetical protein [Alphaproteobacteria bacterium]